LKLGCRFWFFIQPFEIFPFRSTIFI